MAEIKQSRNGRVPVVFVPGGVTPARLSYGALLRVLGDEVQAVVKDLEVYAGDTPPPDYGLEMEVAGIQRVATAAELLSFHLVGYSAGGAASLAFAARYPERLTSLALIEPAWIGNEGLTAEEEADLVELDRVMTLPPEKRMREFMRWHMREGVEPPALPQASGSPPPWMAKRPAGLRAIDAAFHMYHLDRELFRRFRQPVYYALGSLSRPYFERTARTLAEVFPALETEMYEGRSHLDPPHRAEPERFARALHKLWQRADAVTVATV